MIKTGLVGEAMASQGQRSAAFWYEYDRLRRAARQPPSAIDIAKVANKAGVSFEEALDAMQPPVPLAKGEPISL